jgi:hypothetical protein
LLPVSIVFPCALSIDSYASAGADVEVPRPDCPDCSAPTTFWWGYWRYVREPDRCRKVFVRRVACRACGSTHALLPSFLLARRRDAAPVIGAALEHVAEGRGGARLSSRDVGHVLAPVARRRGQDAERCGWSARRSCVMAPSRRGLRFLSALLGSGKR